MLELKLNDLKEGEDFGIKLGRLLQGGDVICLDGDLGAGKTTLTKSIGIGLGVEDYITSPTFTLINEYEGRLNLYHFDFYRLEVAEELYDLGFDDYFYGKGVSIIEWGERIKSMLPKDRMVIQIEKGDSLDSRILHIKAHGQRYKELIKELEDN